MLKVAGVRVFGGGGGGVVAGVAGVAGVVFCMYDNNCAFPYGTTTALPSLIVGNNVASSTR